jgi:hypothetical protein
VARCSLVALAAIFLASAAQAQEPQTRAEMLAAERQAKSKQLEPPKPTGLERALLALENDRLFERILNPAEGFYPKIGNVTTGSATAFGPAYRHPFLIGEEVDFSAFAAASFDKYWMVDARLTMPQLAGGRAFADVHVRRYDFPEEQFFGLGPDSPRENETTYGLRSTDSGVAGGVRVTPSFAIGAGLEHLTPRVSTLGQQPDFLRLDLSADLNTREPRGNPRGGYRYTLAYHRFDPVSVSRAGFSRVDADVQHYISLYRNRRVLALRGLASVSDEEPGGVIPFYYMRTLGGPDDLRGFHRFRFRDRHLILLQAEYRWEVFTAMDAAIFYDAGKVASRLEDLNFRDLERDYGIGVRFGTRNGVFLRVEGAFGSSGGKHFIMRWGHVF